MVGLKHLYAFHLNDSKTPFNQRKDVHASLGKGKIGLNAFHLLMKHPKTKWIPKFLETQRAAATAYLLENNSKALKSKKKLIREIKILTKDYKK